MDWRNIHNPSCLSFYIVTHTPLKKIFFSSLLFGQIFMYEKYTEFFLVFFPFSLFELYHFSKMFLLLISSANRLTTIRTTKLKKKKKKARIRVVFMVLTFHSLYSQY